MNRAVSFVLLLPALLLAGNLTYTASFSRSELRITQADGYDVVEMPEADVCCGMGGSYSIKMPGISASMLQRKLDNIAATGIHEVGLDCPGCLMQIRGGIAQQGHGPRVRHTAERLAERLAD